MVTYNLVTEWCKFESIDGIILQSIIGAICISIERFSPEFRVTIIPPVITPSNLKF